MAYYSEEFIEEVLAANDIVDVISGYVHLQKKGNSLVGLCPFHNEKTPSFTVTPDRQMYYCFGCGDGGSVLTFLMHYENLTFPEAVESLAKRAHIELPQQEMSAAQRREAERRGKLLEINRTAAVYYYAQLRAPQGAQALEYFRSRGLSDETIRRFGLGYSNRYSDDLYRYLKKKGYADSLLKDSGLVRIDERHGAGDRFWDRAMFPIMDADSRVIGFGGRVMGEGKPKYINSPETEIFDKSRNMYGLNYARRSRRPGMLLCEGYMDVIALHQAGFDNAVASLGTAFTQSHANLLKRYTKEVCVTLDGDEAGVRATLRALPLLRSAGLSARVVDLSPCKDPDEFLKAVGPEEYGKRVGNAENSFLFEIRILSQNYNMDDPESKTDFFTGVAERLQRFREPLELENYIEAVSRIYPVGFEQLKALVASVARRGGTAAEEPKRPVAKRKAAKKKEDGPSPAQSMLLTWLAGEPSVFDAVARWVGPEDFTDPVCRRAAGELYAQHARGEINPARILSLFPDEAQEREIAAVFHAKLPSPEEDVEKRGKALTETVRRVRRESIETRIAKLDPGDLEAMQKLIGEKSQLGRIHISLL